MLSRSSSCLSLGLSCQPETHYLVLVHNVSPACVLPLPVYVHVKIFLSCVVLVQLYRVDWHCYVIPSVVWVINVNLQFVVIEPWQQKFNHIVIMFVLFKVFLSCWENRETSVKQSTDLYLALFFYCDL